MSKVAGVTKVRILLLSGSRRVYAVRYAVRASSKTSVRTSDMPRPRKPGIAARGVHWTITVHPRDGVTMPDLIEKVRMFLEAHAKAWVYQHERGGTTGSDHLQVCIRFTRGSAHAMRRCTCSIRTNGLSGKCGLLGMLLKEVSLVMPRSAETPRPPGSTAPSPTPESTDHGATASSQEI